MHNFFKSCSDMQLPERSCAISLSISMGAAITEVFFVVHTVDALLIVNSKQLTGKGCAPCDDAQRASGISASQLA